VLRLGAGALGTVYEAEDVDNEQRTAVKQLHVLDGDALYGFKQEYRIGPRTSRIPAIGT
jgi:serine/threonine protein kinase